MVGDWKDVPSDLCGKNCSSPAAAPIPEGLLMEAVKKVGVIFCSAGEESDGIGKCLPCREGWFNPSVRRIVVLFFF